MEAYCDMFLQHSNINQYRWCTAMRLVGLVEHELLSASVVCGPTVSPSRRAILARNFAYVVQFCHSLQSYCGIQRGIRTKSIAYEKGTGMQFSSSQVTVTRCKPQEDI